MEIRKIVVLTSAHPPFDARIFHKESKSLVQAGYQVVLIAPHTRNEIVDGVQVKAVHRARGRIRRMTRTVASLARLAIRENADVYHLHDPELLPLGLLLRGMGKKVIYDVHEDVPATVHAKYYLPKFARATIAKIIDKFEIFCVKQFCAVIPATPGIAARFIAYNHRCVIVQNFVQVQSFDSRPEQRWTNRPLCAGYVGVISSNRGAREMIGSIQRLQNDEAFLKVAGRFQPPELEAELAQLPGWQRIDYVGILEWQEVHAFLDQLRVGLVLIHPEPRYVVSYPVKLFEYMAAGIPVVASDFPLWRSIIEEAQCGLLVDPLDEAAISAAIQYLLGHSEEAEEMGRRGREAVLRKYSWESEALKLTDLYGGLMR